MEVIKHIRVASAVGALCTSREALQHSIDVLHARLDMYDLEVWLILRERDTCMTSVKELEEVVAVEELTDKEVEMGKEKARYDVKRVMMARKEVVVEEDKDGGEGEEESESDEEDDEPIHGPVLLVEAQGQCPAK